MLIKDAMPNSFYDATVAPLTLCCCIEEISALAPSTSKYIFMSLKRKVPWLGGQRKFINRTAEWTAKSVLIPLADSANFIRSIFLFYGRLETCDALLTFFFSPSSISLSLSLIGPHSWWHPPSVLCPAELSMPVSHTSTCRPWGVASGAGRRDGGCG